MMKGKRPAEAGAPTCPKGSDILLRMVTYTCYMWIKHQGAGLLMIQAGHEIVQYLPPKSRDLFEIS